LHQLFSLLDDDGSGAISTDELSDLMSLLGVNFTREEVEAMVCEIDENNDGEIQFEEFVAVMSRKMRAYYPPDEVKAAFAVFAGNASDNGQIKLADLEKALQTYGTTKLTALEARELVAGLRGDNSGYFDYAEYIEEMYEEYQES
jgi:calmodulin